MLNSVILLFILHEFKKSGSGHLFCRRELEKPVVGDVSQPQPAHPDSRVSRVLQCLFYQLSKQWFCNWGSWEDRGSVLKAHARRVSDALDSWFPTPGNPSVIWWLLTGPLLWLKKKNLGRLTEGNIFTKKLISCIWDFVAIFCYLLMYSFCQPFLLFHKPEHSNS